MKLFKISILLLLAVSASSCASIVSRSVHPVDFNSTPQGAQLTIENRYGHVVFTGKTPTTVWLDASAGYMQAEHYKVTYTQPGREPVVTWIHAELNGWYFGNLFFGGLIGMLIVDPLTGAMFRIPPHAEMIHANFEPSAAVAPVPATPAAPAAPVAPATEASAAPAAPAGEWTPLGE